MSATVSVSTHQNSANKVHVARKIQQNELRKLGRESTKTLRTSVEQTTLVEARILEETLR